jgi:sugar lactone lactonase YvrE
VSLVRSILLEGSAYPEALRWARGRLYFSEFMSRRVMAMESQGSPTPIAFIYGQPSGIGLNPDGTLVVVSMLDNRLVIVRPPESPRLIADLSEYSKGPSNELLLDGRGRAYVGCFGYSAYSDPPEAFEPSNLLLVDEAGSVSIVASDLHFPNGMALLHDGDLLVVAETFHNCLSAFDVSQDGHLSPRGQFTDLGSRSPDGVCLLHDNQLWVACPFSEEIVVVDDQGRIVGAFQTPGRFPVDCTFGEDGEDLLFVGAITSEPADILRGVSKGFIEVYANAINEIK